MNPLQKSQSVIPAHAGISLSVKELMIYEIPAFAGMTISNLLKWTL